MHGAILPMMMQDLERSDGAKTALPGFVIPMASRILLSVSGMRKSRSSVTRNLTVTLKLDAL